MHDYGMHGHDHAADGSHRNLRPPMTTLLYMFTIACHA